MQKKSRFIQSVITSAAAKQPYLPWARDAEQIAYDDGKAALKRA